MQQRPRPRTPLESNHSQLDRTDFTDSHHAANFSLGAPPHKRFTQEPPAARNHRSVLPCREVVVVADVLAPDEHKEPVHSRRDLEQTEPRTLNQVVRAFREFGISVYHYASPAELAANRDKHSDAIVFSIYGGQISRNRMALVPAVCEAIGLRFIGPDAYGRIICQDKYISKVLARDAGLRTPQALVVRELRELELLDDVPMPYVIKPLLEGSSIGISEESLITDRKKGKQLARNLFIEFKQPILVEEFAPGREVSCNFIIRKDEIIWSASETVVNGDSRFFDSHLFDARIKYSAGQREIRSASNLFSVSELKKLGRLIAAVGKMDYCRIDGKFGSEGFVFLEVTPDAWISSEGAFAMGFIQNGWRYADILMTIACACLESSLTSNR